MPSSTTNLTAHQHAVSAAKYQQSGDLRRAEISIINALELDPDNADYLHFLGLVKQFHAHFSEAICLISKAILHNNKNPVFHYNLGVIYKKINQFENALSCQKEAARLDPANTHYLNETGLVYVEMEALSQAEKIFFKSLKLNPHNANTLSNIAYLFRKKHDPEDAIKYAKAALSLNPQLSAAYMNLGQALVMVNHIKKGIHYINKSFSCADQHLLASQQSVLLYMLYISDFSPWEIFKKHQQFSQQYLPSTYHEPKVNTTQKKLNLGFISSDFRFHSVFHFFISLVNDYNKKQFRYYCYSGVSHPDNETNIIKARVDHWRDIYHKSTEEIATQIRNDHIDILFDLSGHTKGNYLPVFTRKPAPIQVTFLGYPFSTGLESIDYKITDEFSDPTGLSETHYSEKLLKISPSFLCYTPYIDIRISKSIPVQRKAYITFGSFNKFSKLSPELLATWSAILTKVKNAQLILKNNQPISNSLANHILSAFSAHGISKERITLISPTVDIETHLRHYNDIDICLDTFPYNGTTTTFEALWMGVPVISLIGEDHRSRVGNSILQTLGHKTLLAANRDEYVSIAANLAKNKNMIKYYRESLRKDLKASLLTDGKTYTKKFEQLMQNVWKTHWK
ncbi:MAG TPA: tetratricopeptide repeat protein [Gammaproteobacteria bacterium]|nr:tetratricopeptide repeat protein [Gammaproteobacteria bacterium]